MGFGGALIGVKRSRRRGAPGVFVAGGVKV